MRVWYSWFSRAQDRCSEIPLICTWQNPNPNQSWELFCKGKGTACWDLSPEITELQNTSFSFQTLLWGAATTLSSWLCCPWGVSSPLGVPRAVSIPLSPPWAGFYWTVAMGVSPELSSGTKPSFRGHLWSQGHPAQQVQSSPESWDHLVLDQSTDTCKWCPKSPLPGCSFSSGSETLEGLDLEIQF